jgi:hypothetical protein
MRRPAVLVVALAACAAMAAPTRAQQMPDPALIHGRALPAPELATGTVTVRLVRESIGNDAPDQRVTVTVGNRTSAATTDAMGRAEFANLPAGQEGRATVTVDGEALESQPFTVPSSGGLRVILVAGIARAAERRASEAAAAASAPAVPGTVVFGGNSRVLMQFSDDTLQVYYVLDVVNSARARVDVGGPLVIELPPAAAGPTLLEGSSPAGTLSGHRLTIAGPFPSGTTSIQIAYRLPHASSTLTLAQAFPAPFQQMSVGVEKLPGLAMTSSQLPSVSDVTSENGSVFILGRGPALAANTPLTVTLSGLAFHSPTPRYVALGLAAAFLALCTWLGFARRDDTSRQTLQNRREALLQELTQLDAKRREGALAPARYAARRQRAVHELERVLGQLDERHTRRGGDEGVAA